MKKQTKIKTRNPLKEIPRLTPRMLKTSIVSLVENRIMAYSSVIKYMSMIYNVNGLNKHFLAEQFIIEECLNYEGF